MGKRVMEAGHKTSIVILSYHTLAYTRLCIESIRTYTEPGTYEIIVVDNGSQDGSVEYLKQQEDVHGIFNAENQGFPRGCNQGMQIAKGDEILLLNSDTVVTAHWLGQLRAGLYSAEDVGAVGCVTNYCSNGQQIEVPYHSVEEMQAFAAGYNHTDPSQWEERTTLVGYCLLFRREVYQKIGGLDERFNPGNFEDDDYCVRIWQAGYRCLLLKDTFIHHFGSVSFARDESPEAQKEKTEKYQALLRRNQHLFQKKWHLPENYKSMPPKQLVSFLSGREQESDAAGNVMNDGRIAIFVPPGGKDERDACLASIRTLKVPEGYELKIVQWQDRGESLPEIERQLTQANAAKYKIFLDPRVSFVAEDVLFSVLEIFRSNPEVGAIGVCGSRCFSRDEAGLDRVGGFFAMDGNGKPREYNWPLQHEDAAYEYVQHLNGMMFATQYDLPAQETGAVSWLGEHLLRSFDYADFGYRLAVPRQEHPWCFFAADMPAWLDGVPMDCLDRFYHGGVWGSCGAGTQIGEVTADHPERVRISVQSVIGDKVSMTAGAGIRIGDSVSIGQGAEIAASGAELVIGNRAEIGAGAVLEGALRIGTGAVVAPGSHVLGDVPPYCHVQGSPAKITSFFDVEKCAWQSALLGAKRVERPVLTVAIPTFNRARFLAKSLHAICAQAGDNPFVEIFVSDNASTDDTPRITGFYEKQYSNVRIVRQKENIGGAKNFDFLRRHARGKFVVTIGDDDYFCPDVIHSMLRTIFLHPDSAILTMLWAPSGYREEAGDGMDYYLQKASFTITYITALLFRTEYVRDVVIPEKFEHGFIPQVAVQMEILRRHPEFATFSMHYLLPSSGEAVRTSAEERNTWKNNSGLLNFGKVFIDEYFTILQYYIGKGLSEASYRMEMKKELEGHLLPWSKMIQQGTTLYHTGDVLKYYDQYYRQEPYYAEERRLLEAYVETDTVYQDMPDDRGV